jgi:hypothetical protein
MGFWLFVRGVGQIYRVLASELIFEAFVDVGSYQKKNSLISFGSYNGRTFGHGYTCKINGIHLPKSGRAAVTRRSLVPPLKTMTN